jgi:hypothetical protein
VQQPTKTQLKAWLKFPKPVADLRAQIAASPTTPHLLDAIRHEVPDVAAIPQTTYTLYREFEYTGQRDGYQDPYFLKRAQLSRAVLEYIMGDESMLDAVHDLIWSICEETSWVLPAHEEQGPDYWEIHDQNIPRTGPFGARHHSRATGRNRSVRGGNRRNAGGNSVLDRRRSRAGGSSARPAGGRAPHLQALSGARARSLVVNRRTELEWCL